ncbi:MAG TPA: endonuclease [Chitinophagaceae bacterium]|nr:endonuclease [Chitinophagaceae bacterium]
MINHRVHKTIPRWSMFIIATACFSTTFSQQVHKAMSFNIRYDNPGDSLNAWPLRKDLVASQVRFHRAGILGVQEALHQQVLDLSSRLPTYAYIGAGRDDGKWKGESCSIFYDSSLYRKLDAGHLWLSETPELAGSKGWDASLPRMLSWVALQTINGSQVFFVFNTHFDHMGKKARAESARMILKQVQQISGSSPAIIMGDFNATPSDEPVQIITDQKNPLHLTDSRQLSAGGHYGPNGSFNGFGPREQMEEPIDFIFLKGKWTVLQHAALSQTWQGRFASDHFAIYAELMLP